MDVKTSSGACSPCILCLDAGSSSLRFTAYNTSRDRFTTVLAGEATGFGQPPGHFSVHTSTQNVVDENVAVTQHWDAPSALERVWQLLDRYLEAPLGALGHRIVFGGPNHVAPAYASDAVLRELNALIPLDELHLKAELDIVDASRKRFPNLPQVLCFDTAFHRAMPSIAKLLPLPHLDPALQRYGFHGLSYEFVLSTLGPQTCGRLIIAHLGNGASLCAIRDGRPIDTTMGFSPLGGLMMGTRPGDLDPGVILFLLRERRFDVDQLANLVAYHSGLAGTSGISASMQTLLEHSASDERARIAVDLFIYQLVKMLGAMLAVLGGLDMLVFTGGIGEKAAVVRARACSAFKFLGIAIDSAANSRNEPVISEAKSKIKVQVVHTDENLMVARHTAKLVAEKESREHL